MGKAVVADGVGTDPAPAGEERGRPWRIGNAGSQDQSRVKETQV